MGEWRRGGRAALVIAAAAASTACSLPRMPSLPKDAGFEVGADYWQAQPDGHVAIGGNGILGVRSHASATSDLGLESERLLTWNAALDLGEHRLGVEWLPLGWSGDTRTGSGFGFDGDLFPAGDVVDGDLELDTWVFAWDYTVESQRATADEFRLGLAAWWWDFDLEARAAPSGSAGRRAFSRIYPGAQATWILEMGQGSTLDLRGAYATLGHRRSILDWSAEFAYPVSDAIRLAIGYRSLTLDFDHGHDDARLNFQGPLASLSLRF